MSSVSKQLWEKEEANNIACVASELPAYPTRVEMGGGYSAYELPDRQKSSALSAHDQMR